MRNNNRGSRVSTLESCRIPLSAILGFFTVAFPRECLYLRVVLDLQLAIY